MSIRISCSQCGEIKENLSLTDRVYECISCGHKENRDINASKNILKLGLATLGLGNNLEVENFKAFRSTSLEVVS